MSIPWENDAISHKHTRCATPTPSADLISATSIASAYAAIIALSHFGGNSPSLPAHGLLPTIFLAAAIALSAVYVGYLTRAKPVAGYEPTGLLTEDQIGQRNAFITWAGASISGRGFLLAAAVASLSIGVLILPAPFIPIATGDEGWVITLGLVIGVIIVCIVGVVSFLSNRRVG